MNNYYTVQREIASSHQHSHLISSTFTTFLMQTLLTMLPSDDTHAELWQSCCPYHLTYAAFYHLNRYQTCCTNHCSELYTVLYSFNFSWYDMLPMTLFDLDWPLWLFSTHLFSHHTVNILSCVTQASFHTTTHHHEAYVVLCTTDCGDESQICVPQYSINKLINK